MKEILLLGNGLDRSYNSHGISWGNLLRKMTTVPDIPEHKNLPFPLEVVLRTDDHVDEVLRKCQKDLFGSVEDEELRDVLTELLTMGFDEILTTNYDYTLEGTAIYPQEITPWQIKKLMRHTDGVQFAENKYMLYTYNSVNCKGTENRIWHIHGEARKPDSIIIGHYYYVHLVSRWRDIIKERERKYRYFDQTKPSECWLDSFIMGNVYVLGFGFDFSELDLWWLINRKKRESVSPHGEIIFYTPQNNKDAAKYALLKAYGVKIEHLGFQLPEEKAEEDGKPDSKAAERIKKKIARIYSDFYKASIEDIRRRMDK